MRTGVFARETFRILAPPLATLVAVAVALRLLNGLPGYIQSITAAPVPPPPALNERLEFPTVEAAESDLGVKVTIPRYFPSYLAWPPASIRGQRDHARVVSLLFRSDSGEQALQIREVYWPEEELPFPIPEPLEVLERRDVDVNGVVGRLLEGRGQGSTPVNQLRWHATGVHLVVTTIYPVEELLRISRSIHVE